MNFARRPDRLLEFGRRLRKEAVMPCCYDLKVGQIWVCEECGLELQVVKECECSDEEPCDCDEDLDFTCCGETLRKKQ